MCAFEYAPDGIQPEIEQGSTDQFFEWFCKKDGKDAAAEANGNTLEMFDPSGTSIVASAGINPTAVGSNSKFKVTINASNVSTFLKNEGYEARLKWKVSGASDFTKTPLEFAIVARRWPNTISLSDLQIELHWAGELCAAVATALGLSSAEDAARNAIYSAQRELDAKLRALAQGLISRDSLVGFIRGSSRRDRVRPCLVYDQRAMRRVWTFEAITALLLSSARGGTQDEAVELFKMWRARADIAWEQLGELRYDQSQDGLPDTRIQPGVAFWSR